MRPRGKFDIISKHPVAKYYKTNQYIQAKEVRVVDEEGRQVGVMPIFNAIQKAREAEVDLVEVAPGAKPPVCKIIDFKKFLYIEAKKEQEEKKAQKGGDIKEVQLSPFIAKNDFQTRVKKTRQFIEENNKVKVRVRFKGREMNKKDFGFRLIEEMARELEGTAVKENEPKFFGREISVVFGPQRKK